MKRPKQHRSHTIMHVGFYATLLKLLFLPIEAYALSPFGKCLYRKITDQMKCDRQTKISYTDKKRYHVTQSCRQNANVQFSICVQSLDNSLARVTCSIYNLPFKTKKASKYNQKLIGCFNALKHAESSCQIKYAEQRKKKRRKNIEKCLQKPRDALKRCADKNLSETYITPPYMHHLFDYPLWLDARKLKINDVVYACYSDKKTRRWEKARIIKRDGALMTVSFLKHKKTKQFNQQILLPITTKPLRFPTKKEIADKKIQITIVNTINHLLPSLWAFQEDKTKLPIKENKLLGYEVSTNNKDFIVTIHKIALPHPFKFKLTPVKNRYQHNTYVCEPISHISTYKLPDACVYPTINNDYIFGDKADI